MRGVESDAFPRLQGCCFLYWASYAVGHSFLWGSQQPHPVSEAFIFLVTSSTAPLNGYFELHFDYAASHSAQKVLAEPLRCQ